MIVIKSRSGYYYKIYRNGRKKRISKKEFLKLKKLKGSGQASGTSLDSSIFQKLTSQNKTQTMYKCRLCLSLINSNSNNAELSRHCDKKYNSRINLSKILEKSLIQEDFTSRWNPNYEPELSHSKFIVERIVNLLVNYPELMFKKKQK